MISGIIFVEADKTYLDLDYLRYHKKPNLILVLLHIVLEENNYYINTTSHGTQTDIAAWKSCFARNLATN